MLPEVKLTLLIMSTLDVCIIQVVGRGVPHESDRLSESCQPDLHKRFSAKAQRQSFMQFIAVMSLQSRGPQGHFTVSLESTSLEMSNG